MLQDPWQSERIPKDSHRHTEPTPEASHYNPSKGNGQPKRFLIRSPGLPASEVFFKLGGSLEKTFFGGTVGSTDRLGVLSSAASPFEWTETFEELGVETFRVIPGVVDGGGVEGGLGVRGGTWERWDGGGIEGGCGALAGDRRGLDARIVPFRGLLFASPADTSSRVRFAPRFATLLVGFETGSLSDSTMKRSSADVAVRFEAEGLNVSMISRRFPALRRESKDFVRTESKFHFDTKAATCRTSPTAAITFEEGDGFQARKGLASRVDPVPPPPDFNVSGGGTGVRCALFATVAPGRTGMGTSSSGGGSGAPASCLWATMSSMSVSRTSMCQLPHL